MQDIRPSKGDERIILIKKNSITLSLLPTLKMLVFLGVLILFIFQPTANAPSGNRQTQTLAGWPVVGNLSYAAEENAPENSGEQLQETRQELEQKLLDLEQQIKEQQQLVTKTREEKQSIQGEIAQLNAQIRRINLQIEAVDVSLRKLDRDIGETQLQINNTQTKILDHKDALSQAIRSLHEADNQSFVAILLQNNEISDFFNNINDILLIQDTIRGSLNNVVNLRQELLEQKQELGLERDDVENLKAIRNSQKRQLQFTQENKDELLKIAKNKEVEYTELLEETRKTATQVRSQIFRLIGGGELTFEKAYEFARLAEGATGIRAAMVLAILDRESLLGKNVGNCSYQDAMRPDRDIPVFLKILEVLNIEPNSTVAKVSCPIRQHGSYGGAMGPAQFIPSTWAIYGGYEKSGSTWKYDSDEDYIGEVVGKKPSNPWSNADAFAATSLYISDLYNSRTCKNYADGLKGRYPEQELREECAAAMYYSGSRWKTYYTWYGIPVVERANEIQKDINILNS